MHPVFTHDAVVLGLLLLVLAAIFYTSSSDHPAWKKFYTYVPPLLLCYFIPALLHWPLKLISPEFFDLGINEFLADKGVSIPKNASTEGAKTALEAAGIESGEYSGFLKKSKLYHVASRFLLPASLVLLCLSIDIKGILRLGPKALIMFFAATLGIIIGGPIALLIVSVVAPNLIGGVGPEELWRGNLFGTMIVVDVVVANIWMGFLLYGAKISDKLDRRLRADNSAIESLKESVSSYRAKIQEMPTVGKLFALMAVAFVGTGLGHWGANVIVPALEPFSEGLIKAKMTSLLSPFFWLIVISTTFGLILSFTKFKKLEGVGASRWGTIFIYILVATIGMKMNLGEVFNNLGLFAVGLIWMAVHVTILLITAKIIKAPFFFVAVGSQANVGGAASAPVVAAAFNPSLAPVGVLMAVLGYALGTYGAYACALLMQWASSFL